MQFIKYSFSLGYFEIPEIFFGLFIINYSVYKQVILNNILLSSPCLANLLHSFSSIVVEVKAGNVIQSPF